MLRTVNATRYIQPLREGGSLPALIEADDGRMYVVKLRGAGQGTLALVAELVSGEIARALGLNVPELVLVEVDALFAKAERDPEIQHLLRASTGTNIGLAFLSGSTMFDPAAGDSTEPATASLLVWLDAFTLNVDRTSRNANLLLCKAQPNVSAALWLIDHGASLYFHHNWPSAQEKALAPFTQTSDHILLRSATELSEASALAHTQLNEDVFRKIVAQIPNDWLAVKGEDATAQQRRDQYVEFLSTRLQHSRIFEEEVERARANSL